MSMGYIRSQANRFYLTTSCTVEEEQSTQDANNFNVTAWVAVAHVRCRILPAGQGDTERVETFASQEGIRVIKRIALPHDTALDVGQRITVGSDVYQVASLDVANTDEAFRQAVLVQMKGTDNA